MVEINDKKLYRNSSLQGDALPLEILLSKGLIKQDFTVTPANAIALPTDTELLVVYGDDVTSCYLMLGSAVVVPVNGVFSLGLHYIPSGSIKVIDGNGATHISLVSRTSEAGTLIIECAYAYKDARKPKQLTNT